MKILVFLSLFIPLFGQAQPCRDSERERLWAQEVVDSDLMLDEMRAMGIDGDDVKIAIYDTGFDAENSSSLLFSSEISFGEVPSFNLAAENDPDGHGTFIAGLIGGKKGLGINSNAPLGIFSAYKRPPETEALNILSICEQGFEIINYSQASVAEEIGELMMERDGREFLSMLKNKGCLLVKAAGNSFIKKNFSRYREIRDSVLHIESSGRDGLLADFSNRGEIRAPGDNVFSFTSSQNGDPIYRRNLCYGHEGRFGSGTSFSTPLVAAIAAATKSVLYSFPFYQRLPKSNQIEVLAHILKASEFNQQINGLKSVRLAKYWGERPDANFQIESLQSGFAQSLNPLCLNQNMNGSFESKRRILSLCTSSLDKLMPEAKNKTLELIFHFFPTLVATGKLEVAAQYLGQVYTTLKRFPKELLTLPPEFMQDFLLPESLLEDSESYQYTRLSLYDLERKIGFLGRLSAWSNGKLQLPTELALKLTERLFILSPSQALGEYAYSSYINSILYKLLENRLIKAEFIDTLINLEGLSLEHLEGIQNLLQLYPYPYENVHLNAFNLWKKIKSDPELVSNFYSVLTSPALENKIADLISLIISEGDITKRTQENIAMVIGRLPKGPRARDLLLNLVRNSQTLDLSILTFGKRAINKHSETPEELEEIYQTIFLADGYSRHLPRYLILEILKNDNFFPEDEEGKITFIKTLLNHPGIDDQKLSTLASLYLDIKEKNKSTIIRILKDLIQSLNFGPLTSEQMHMFLDQNFLNKKEFFTEGQWQELKQALELADERLEN